MSKGVNKCIIIGNACSDPECRYMPNGNAVTNLSVATNESWKDKQTGKVNERVEFHRVVFFGRLAEIVGEYVREGSKLYVEGRLQTREWEKDGVKRYTTEVVVDINGQMQLLDSRGQGGGDNMGQRPQQSRPAAPQQQQQYAQQPAPAQQPQQMPDYDSFDDDIPF